MTCTPPAPNTSWTNTCSSPVQVVVYDRAGLVDERVIVDPQDVTVVEGDTIRVDFELPVELPVFSGAP